MLREDVAYQFQENTHQGYIVYDNEVTLKRPGVLVVHDWSGRNDFACQAADKLAALGYVGFAVDMYGNKQLGETNDEKVALMSPLVEDRPRLQGTLQAGLEALQQCTVVDADKIAIIGFCFGGLCALDLARSGANLRGAVSFHGLLMPADNIAQPQIKAKILALHGHEDPMVSPEDVTTFTEEMTSANADWQIHIYGNTKHAFTNPLANDQELGTIYNPVMANRAWRAMENFLAEIF